MAKKKEITEEEVVVSVVEETIVEAPVAEEVNPYTIGHATRAFRG
jgi:hypothetical protein